MSSTRSGLAARLFPTVLIAALVGFGLYFDRTVSDAPPPEQTAVALDGELAREAASPDVRRVVQWAVATQDHGSMPFVVVDKLDARIFAFDSQGRLRGSGPVLLGALGSDEDGAQATPAGRFVADTLASARGGGIVWVNANTELALHALPVTQSAGPNLQRFASLRVSGKRASEGSLHVTPWFFKECLDGLRTQPSIAYVLPETVPLEQVFGPAAAKAAAIVAQNPRHQSGRRPS